jgi:phage tail protein X
MASTGFISYVTTAGDRWDLLAWRFYGDPTDYSPMIMANPPVPIEPVFEAGIQIAIPILTQAPGGSVNLPPWKRTPGVA